MKNLFKISPKNKSVTQKQNIGVKHHLDGNIYYIRLNEVALFISESPTLFAFFDFS